jgi:hypothetical protein
MHFNFPMGKTKGAKDKVKRKPSLIKKHLKHAGLFPKGKGNGDERQRAGGRAKKGVEGVHRPLADELAARKIDKALIDRMITLNSHLSVKDLERKIQRGSLSTIEHVVCSGLVRAAHTGDYNSINFFFDRLIGKVAQKLEVSPGDPFEGMSTEDLIKEKLRLDESNRQTLDYLMKTRGITAPESSSQTNIIDTNSTEGSTLELVKEGSGVQDESNQSTED